MKSSKAFWGGVLGALMMVIIMWIARTIAGTTISMSMLLGTILIPPGSTAWTLGLFMHLVIGGMVGLIYGWVFEHACHKGGISTGITLGALHAIVAGLVLGVMPAIHPRIPDSVAAPGYFMSNMGVVGVVTLFVLHVVYGGVVGGMYGSVSHPVEVAHDGAGARVI